MVCRRRGGHRAPALKGRNALTARITREGDSVAAARAAVPRRRWLAPGLLVAIVTSLCVPADGADAREAVRGWHADTIATPRISADARRATSFPRTFVGAKDGRMAVFRSRDGAFRRYLTDEQADVGLASVTPNRKKVFYVRVEDDGCPATYVVPLAGGSSSRVRRGNQGGGQPIAAGANRALAGNYACIASMYIVARAGDGETYYISGTRDRGADGMAWAPDARRLAVATLTEGVLRMNVTEATGLHEAKGVPCPRRMRSCATHAPSYAPNGILYYVAENRAGTIAKVVRLIKGRARPGFVLPRVSAHYSLAIAAGGHVLVSGDADSATMTRSQFVRRWDGSRQHRLRRSMLQVDW